MRRYPHIAIIILNWRRSDLTIDCVKSFQNSDYKNFRIFVVDNGSDDGSAERLASELTDVEIIALDQNYGYAGGNNRAFEEIADRDEFDLVLVSNNDLMVCRDTLKELVGASEKLGKENIFVPAMYMGETGDTVVCGEVRSMIPSPLQFKYYPGGAELKVKETPYLAGAFFLIGKKLLRKLGGFQEDFYMYGEDIDLGLRVQKLGARIYLVPTAKVRHKFHGTTGRFSPLSRYYLARNVPRLIGEYSQRKALDYFLFVFWGILSLPFLFLILKFKSVAAWIWGLADFFRGKRGQNIKLERW